jgi:hypothetical protein
MAVDTRDKRMSMLGLAKASVRLFQNPTGTIGAAARAILEFLYSGILPSAPVAALPRVLSLRASVSTALAMRASNSAAVSLSASRSTAITMPASEA